MSGRRLEARCSAFLPVRPRFAALRIGSLGDWATRVVVHQLHGGLDADAQDAALVPSGAPRVILATNIAETTLTVPDVTVVIDAGLQKVARYDADRGLDSLETERISQDAADQRAGRAGRLAPGRAIRLWDARDRLRPHREPDIARVDLAAPVMDVIGWGGDPRTLEWFEAPPADALAQSYALLAALGVIDGAGHLTSDGRNLRRLPAASAAGPPAARGWCGAGRGARLRAALGTAFPSARTRVDVVRPARGGRS